MKIRLKNKLLTLLAIYIMISCTEVKGKDSTVINFIQNGDFTLAAKICKPDGNGNFHTVVHVHGSNNYTKDSFQKYSAYFASHRIITVNYTKRGQGISVANMNTSTFFDLTKDVVAIVQRFKSQPYIDPNWIGLWSDSQGGWIILIADNLFFDIAHIINKSGSVMTPMDSTQCL